MTTTGATGGMGGGGVGGQGGAAGSVTLSNATEGCQGNPVAPLQSEIGHLAASTLSPTTYPFTVTELAYDLLGGQDCDSTLAHRVDVFVIDGKAPPSSPSTEAVSFEAIDVPANAGSSTGRTVTLPLENPIVLSQGQSLVVAVEMAAGEGTATSCIALCVDTAPTESSWWSNAAAEPYAWADMVADFGFLGTYTIRASGHN